ncbi:MAG: hypothetical protein LBM75_04950, partial [Myxococcales bacterium]|nr:hypothetical protein [Myxococcales bacterium]
MNAPPQAHLLPLAARLAALLLALGMTAACQTPVAESRLRVGDRAFAEGRFEDAAAAWSDDDPAIEAALLFRHALLCQKRDPPCLPEDERALLQTVARDYPTNVFGISARLQLELEKEIAQALAFEPLLDECLRMSIDLDARLDAERASKTATDEELRAAQAQLTKLSRLAELQSF